MSREIREDIEKRALTAMLTDAFYTWPSAVTIAFTILMFFLNVQIFPGWQNWYWIIAGAVMEGIYLVATLTDPVASQQAVSRMLEEQYDPRDIKNQVARQRLQKALEYKKNIDLFVAKQAGAMREAMSQTATEINDWIALIYRLASSIDAFEGNAIIDRDRRSVPTELENLKRRLKIETDPGVRAELAEAIEIREKLLNNLRSIENNAKRTEIKMDNTVAQLSTVYAQMQLLNARELDSSRAQRLRSEIQEEVASLSDMISAMGDVYDYQGYSGAARDLQAEGGTASSAASSGTETNDSDYSQGTAEKRLRGGSSDS
jgi:hypothetical protein